MKITIKEFRAVSGRLEEKAHALGGEMTACEWGIYLAMLAKKYREEMADLNDFSWNNYHKKENEKCITEDL